MSTFKVNCAKQEFDQLKKLNNMLIDEKWRLEEELRISKQRERVQAIFFTST